jgi:hypothetical protein
MYEYGRIPTSMIFSPTPTVTKVYIISLLRIIKIVKLKKTGLTVHRLETVLIIQTFEKSNRKPMDISEGYKYLQI